MKSIKERNQEAIERMKAKHLQNLEKDSLMSLGDVIEFGIAAVRMVERVKVEDERELMYHLLCRVDTQEDGIGVWPRYKLILKYSWAIDNCIRDWNNRYSMGR